jgi:hypothetical protein
VTTTAATLPPLVVPSPGRQFDRWDLDPWPPPEGGVVPSPFVKTSTFAPSGCFGGQDGEQVGSRSGAEARLFDRNFGLPRTVVVDKLSSPEID